MKCSASFRTRETSCYSVSICRHGSVFTFCTCCVRPLLVVTANLASALDCTYVSDETVGVNQTAETPKSMSSMFAGWEDTSSYLDGKPEWKCWDSQASPQLAYATVAMLCLLYYVPTAVLLAPFVTADSDGFFQPDELDVSGSDATKLHALLLVLTARE
jgi:hypothetical protein